MPNHLTLGDVAAYLSVMRERLAPWEADALLGMDAVWLESVHERAEQPKVAERKLTPALFDAIL